MVFRITGHGAGVPGSSVPLLWTFRLDIGQRKLLEDDRLRGLFFFPAEEMGVARVFLIFVRTRSRCRV